jgi:hypothetical protein
VAGDVEATPNGGRLRELEWLVGDWAHADDADQLTLSCRWAPNKSFLVQEFHVRAKDAEPLTVTQWVGWDPIEGQIHSWFFDSHGGHGQGRWSRSGNSWRVENGGVTPDGRTGASLITLKFGDERSFGWQMTDRQLDGQPLADVDVRLVRKAGK